MKLWICEKPSQAESLANELGNNGKQNGFIKTNDGLVTWCFGHLLQLAPAEFYNSEFKQWTFSTLPIFPATFENQANESSINQLNIIGKLLSESDEVVISTDGDREGEAIGRNVLNHFNFQGEIKRLWLGALDPISIQRALGKIKEGSETAALFDAATARNHADWLIGINGTRAATVKFSPKGVVSLGRVQTPTLAMIVKRDLDIKAFTAEKFYDFIGSFKVGDNPNLLDLKHNPTDDLRIYDKAEAENIKETLSDKQCEFEVKCVRKKKAPPKLFSLSGLQIETNKKWGWAADKTLELAQALYETHKVTSYPRSDCTYLPMEQEGDIEGILQHLSSVEDFESAIKSLSGKHVIRKSVFNTDKVTAHHAIIPTLKAASLERLSDDEKALYMLISSHFVACLMPDYEYDETMISTTLDKRTFKQAYSFTKAIGWCSLLGGMKKDAEGLPEVVDGQQATLKQVELDEKVTSPPKRYTEALLLKDMTNIAKYVDDDSHKATLKETSGIGTEATRASIISTLKDRELIKVEGKSLIATPSGVTLIQALPDSVTSAVETALWEDELSDIANGTGSYDDFMLKVRNKVTQLLKDIEAQSKEGVRIVYDNSDSKPSDAMAGLVKKISTITGNKVSGYENDIIVCRDFLDKHSEIVEQNKDVPSEKAKEFALKIAKALDIALPDNCEVSAAACSKFIEDNKDDMPSFPPSEAQLKFAVKIAKTAKQTLTDEIKASGKLCSQYITDNKSSLPKTKSKAGKSRGTKSLRRRVRK